jgi:hypothetical protein
MRRLVRVFLLWLIAMALPLQGVAAATMFACGIQHDAQAAAHGGQDHHEHHATGHGDHAHAADLDDDSPDNPPPHKCSACAACCVGAALPAATLVVASVDLTEFHQRFADRSVPVFITEGPERPPRFVLA